MPYNTMLLEIQVNDSVKFKKPLQPYMYVTEELITNLQVMLCLHLHESVQASEHIGG